MLKKHLVIIFCSCFFSLLSQSLDSVSATNKLESYTRLQYDNDFFSATDRYYTQGIQLSFVNKIIKFSPFSYALIRLNKTALNYYGLLISQDCFTPKSIRYDTLNYLERPFAATFYVSHALSSLNADKKLALYTQLDLGVIGPCARCEDEQKAIHRALLNIRPLGWENQLKNDYLVNYRIKIEKGIAHKKNAEMILNTAARLGTFYTDLGVGLMGRVGFFSPYFTNLGMDKFSKHRQSNFQFYALLKANIKVVGYNATLQGGLFNDKSIYTISNNRVSRVVADAMAGIVLTYKRIGLEYSRFYVTKEFKEGVDHGWGRCVITYCF